MATGLFGVAGRGVWEEFDLRVSQQLISPCREILGKFSSFLGFPFPICKLRKSVTLFFSIQFCSNLLLGSFFFFFFKDRFWELIPIYFSSIDLG